MYGVEQSDDKDRDMVSENPEGRRKLSSDQKVP